MFSRLFFIACQVLPRMLGHGAKEGAGYPSSQGEGSEPDVPEHSLGTLQPSAFAAAGASVPGPQLFGIEKNSGNPYPSSQCWRERASSSPQPIPSWTLGGWVLVKS